MENKKHFTMELIAHNDPFEQGMVIYGFKEYKQTYMTIPEYRTCEHNIHLVCNYDIN